MCVQSGSRVYVWSNRLLRNWKGHMPNNKLGKALRLHVDIQGIAVWWLHGWMRRSVQVLRGALTGLQYARPAPLFPPFLPLSMLLPSCNLAAPDPPLSPPSSLALSPAATQELRLCLALHCRGCEMTVG